MTDHLTSAVGRPPVDAGQFRSLMATLPAGVAVVTTTAPDGRPWGMTCSSICSVSLRPPILLACLREQSPTLAALLESSVFAVNLLHDRAEATATLFASGAADRFDRVPWSREPVSGVPHLVEAAHAIADCSVEQTLRVGDHLVVFGTVHRVRTQPERSANPLLYGMRRYWSLAGVPS
jgi:flavin reductase (DIM6/NTAB) family NADH-FMN oxidoreductase RutF